MMVFRISRTIALGCCLVFGTAVQGLAADYDHTVEAENISFSWKIEGDNLAGKVSAKTEGWVGVGFNPSEKMKDANIILGYVKNDKVTVVDDFGSSATGHKDDDDIGGTRDVTVVGGSEENGVTTIEFVIPMQSSDAKDSKLEKDGDTVLLLAYGAGRDSFFSKHKYRTSMTVNLGTGEVKQ